LVVIFVHLYEMFMGVRPSVRLFRSFYVLKAVSQHPPLINSYYFQRWTQGHAHYITPVSPGRWERLREDWTLVKADAHDRLALPTSALTLDRAEWVKDPGLELGFNPVWRALGGCCRYFWQWTPPKLKKTLMAGPWGCYRYFWQRLPSKLKKTSMTGTLEGVVGISGNGYHRS
jgi:hypothetical protein